MIIVLRNIERNFDYKVIENKVIRINFKDVYTAVSNWLANNNFSITNDTIYETFSEDIELWLEKLYNIDDFCSEDNNDTVTKIKINWYKYIYKA